MAKLISGSLYVGSYTPTQNLGEYIFESGLYNNQNDTGNGAFDIVPGFVVYIPATNINTGSIIPGVSNRYLITSVTVLDNVRVSGTILWDSLDLEEDSPSPGVFSIITQTTPNLKIGVPPVDNNYFDLTPGSTIAAMLNDIINIMDRLGNNTSKSISTILPVTVDGQTQFTLEFTPTNNTTVFVTVNGLKYVYGVTNDFIITGKLLIWTNISLVLDNTDVVVISYTY